MDYAKKLNQVIADEFGVPLLGHFPAVTALHDKHGDPGLAATWLYWDYVAGDQESIGDTIEWCSRWFAGGHRSLSDWAESRYGDDIRKINASLGDHVDWEAFANRLEDDGKIETVDDHRTDVVYVFDTR